MHAALDTQPALHGSYGTGVSAAAVSEHTGASTNRASTVRWEGVEGSMRNTHASQAAGGGQVPVFPSIIVSREDRGEGSGSTSPLHTPASSHTPPSSPCPRGSCDSCHHQPQHHHHHRHSSHCHSSSSGLHAWGTHACTCGYGSSAFGSRRVSGSCGCGSSALSSRRVSGSSSGSGSGTSGGGDISGSGGPAAEGEAPVPLAQTYPTPASSASPPNTARASIHPSSFPLWTPALPPPAVSSARSPHACMQGPDHVLAHSWSCGRVLVCEQATPPAPPPCQHGTKQHRTAFGLCKCATTAQGGCESAATAQSGCECVRAAQGGCECTRTAQGDNCECGAPPALPPQHMTHHPSTPTSGCPFPSPHPPHHLLHALHGSHLQGSTLSPPSTPHMLLSTSIPESEQQLTGGGTSAPLHAARLESLLACPAGPSAASQPSSWQPIPHTQQQYHQLHQNPLGSYHHHHHHHRWPRKW
uniref:Uncharacterized protein n=1 Tax=Dunaliella tertiolecta TaxID=3047 RepID=A0A7S3R4L1_DUNTE